MATAPRPGAGRRADAEDFTMTVKVDGIPYTFRPNEASAVMAGALRREVGMSMNGLLQAAHSDPDIDVLAAIVWLARLQAGDKVGYVEVAEAITYDTDIEPVEEPAQEDPHSPEA